MILSILWTRPAENPYVRTSVHNSAHLFILLVPFQLSFFFWAKLGLFLLFSFAFIFASLITHICVSVIENECFA